MAISESRKKANNKYLEKLEEVRFRVPIGKKAIIQDYASKKGESVNVLMNRLIDEAMAPDAKGGE